MFGSGELRDWCTPRLFLGLGFAVAFTLAACSGDDTLSAGSSGEVDADAATAVVAADPAPSPESDAEQAAPAQSAPDVAEAEAPESAEPASDADETYSSLGIHRILEDSCAACHTPGGPGSTKMALGTAADAMLYADTIGLATAARVMPPWPASDLSVAFVDDHSLSDEEIDAIGRWVEAGGTVDVDPESAIVPGKPIARITEPDLVVTSEKGPYTGSPTVEDDYRCLVFAPEVTDTEWILASHFEPDQVEVVHHGIIHLASQELRAEAEQLDAAEDGPGWSCYGLGDLDTSNGGYQFRMGGWAPGAGPARQPDGYAIPLRPGDFLIVQVHYHFDEVAPADLSRMVFDFASEADLAAVGGSFKALQGALYLGPAEIPCYEGDLEPLCDRDLAVERLERLYGRFNAFLPDYFLANCRSTPQDYVTMNNGTAWSSCDLPVENSGRIVSVAGHMHELGQSIRLTLNPGQPDERILLDIPDWNFEWQFGYQPVEDIIIGKSDTIRVDCVWNRERAPYEAVGYVLWSDGTGDEMCYSSITTAPL